MKWRVLIQAVVVLALIATLAGLFLTRVQKIRDGDYARVQTLNNLKQCALAIHNYHDTYRRLPHAFNKGGSYPDTEKSMWFQLLPFVEADNVYKQNLATSRPSTFTTTITKGKSTSLPISECSLT